jgi:TRAP-type C4-dicarboxylate transport system permease small subunit
MCQFCTDNGWLTGDDRMCRRMNSFDFFKRIDKIQRGIGNIEKIFGITAMAFIICINIYGISSRYLFNRPILYVQELTILGAVWLFFIGMGLVFKVHSDITVEFIVKYFPQKVRMIGDLFVDLLILVFAFMVALETGKFIPFLHAQGESHALSFALELPDEIYFYPIGLGAISIFLTILHRFLVQLLGFRSSWGRTPQE